MNRFCFTLSLLLVLVVVEAQEYRPSIYRAYLHAEMDAWKGLMLDMEAKLAGNVDQGLLYELLEAEYGYVGWLVAAKRKKEAAEILNRAEMHVAQLGDLGLDDARVYSLKGAFFGFRIMLEPHKAPSLGRSSMEANEKAMKLDPTEPQVWLEKANMDYYRPVIFGGSKKKAVHSYEKAIELFESTPDRTEENWIYMNCLAGLGIAYEKTGKTRDAGRVYRKILALEPSFKWVKEELYPRFREKHPGK